jgi:excisionase family DNA binding protein
MIREDAAPAGIASGTSSIAALPPTAGRGGRLRPTTHPLPRLALSPDEASASLGVSRDFFDEHVMPELRIVRRGRRRLVPLRELERWLSAEAALPLRDDR